MKAHHNIRSQNIGLERVRELLSYDAETGKLFWKTALPMKLRNKEDKQAGNVSAYNGYRQIIVDGKHYLAHRIIWFLVHGEWPDLLIDHVNGIKIDNRISNLRLATHSQNLVNSKVHKGNKAGMNGVSQCRKTGKWRAAIGLNGKTKILGEFHSLEKAAEVRKKAELEFYGEFRPNTNASTFSKQGEV